jgi:pimeloyl-ACP methyl ester carboxylesterase
VNPRGVGLSDAPQAERYDIATTAADIAALIETPAHVVGTSLGAAAAIELAITHSDKLKSLTLITPFARVGARLAAVSEAWCELAESASPALVARSLLPWFFGAATLADQAVRRRLARGLATTLAQVSPETLRRQRAGMLAWSGSREADLGRIATPTLVVVAGDDLLAPDALDIAGAVPGAACEIIAGAGHAVGLEAADAVNECLLRHLRG